MIWNKRFLTEITSRSKYSCLDYHLPQKYFKDSDSVIPFWTQLSRKSRSKWENVDNHVKCHAEPSVGNLKLTIILFHLTSRHDKRSNHLI